MHKKISILGSTGSIGKQTLEVVRELNLSVEALTCNSNVVLLAEQILEFMPAVVSVGTAKAASELISLLQAKGMAESTAPEIFIGEQGLITAATMPGIDIVVAAIVGFSGLKPVLAALDSGYSVALANKETLVAGGSLVMNLALRKKAEILPVDSEHSAIWQCLSAASDQKFNKIFLTASGGPFRSYSSAELENVTPSMALKHPTWNMGAKISIDSATMMNKGLEIIEACHLFACRPEQIEVVVHPQSIVHSMVELEDGSVLAQLGFPDMRIPIRLAITWPKRPPASYYKPFDPFAPSASPLIFERADETVFPALRLARDAIKEGGLAPCILNAANEAAVKLFLEKKISFPRIWQIVADEMEANRANITSPDYDTLNFTHHDTMERIRNRYL